MLRALSSLLPLLLALPVLAGPPPDMDSDGTPDVIDLCKSLATVPVPNGCDTDGDGYGNGCDTDFNNDGTSGIIDFGHFGSEWQDTGPPCSIFSDFNGDGTVGLIDFATYGASHGDQPGPSGLPCAGSPPCP